MLTSLPNELSLVRLKGSSQLKLGLVLGPLRVVNSRCANNHNYPRSLGKLVARNPVLFFYLGVAGDLEDQGAEKD